MGTNRPRRPRLAKGTVEFSTKPFVRACMRVGKVVSYYKDISYQEKRRVVVYNTTT